MFRKNKNRANTDSINKMKTELSKELGSNIDEENNTNEMKMSQASRTLGANFHKANQ